MKLKKILYLFLLLIIALICLSIYYVESVFIFYPEIDTRFTKDFSKDKFKLISAGMRSEDVVKLIGKPISQANTGPIDDCWDGKEQDLPLDLNANTELLEIPLNLDIDPDGELWTYTEDGGKYSWSDFAWLEYSVYFTKGRVVKTYQCWHGD